MWSWNFSLDWLEYVHNCSLITLKWCYSFSQKLLCVVELMHEFGSKSHIQRFIAKYQHQAINMINIYFAFIAHLKSYVKIASIILWKSYLFLFFFFLPAASFSSRLKELAVMFSLCFESPLVICVWCTGGGLWMCRVNIRLVVRLILSLQKQISSERTWSLLCDGFWVDQAMTGL